MLGIPSFVGATFAVDMSLGGVILAIWQYYAPAYAFVSAPIVASALIAGDGVWSVPSAILALAKVNPPICAQVTSLPRSIACGLMPGAVTISAHNDKCLRVDPGLCHSLLS